MNKQALFTWLAVGLGACDVRITHTVRLDVEFEDAAFDTSLIKTVQLVLDAKNGRMPQGLSRTVRRADTVEGIIVYSESMDTDGDRSDSEFVLSTEGNPFSGGRRAWGLDITGKDETEFSVEARILNNANEVIARATTSFDAAGRPIKFEDDYKHVVLRVRCEEMANCTGQVTPVPPRPLDAGTPPAEPPDAGHPPAEDAGTPPEDASTPPEDASTPPAPDAGEPDDAGAPPPVDAGPPPDTTPPSFSNVLLDPTTAERGDNVTVSFTVSEALIAEPDVRIDSLVATRISQTGRDYKFGALIPASSDGGTKSVEIRATDQNGNVGSLGLAFVIDVTPGTPDDSFGTGGSMTHSNAGGGNGDDLARAAAFDTSGRLIVVGKTKVDAGAANYERLALWRLTDGGALDTGLQQKGYITHRGLGDGVTVANAVAVAPTGEIYAAGTTTDPNGGSHVAIWGFFSSGNPITSFGESGVMTYSGSAGAGVANGIALKRGANSASLAIYATGYTVLTPGVYDPAVWKTTASGAPDTTFNGSGFVTFRSSANGANRANAIAVADAGEIYVVGSTISATATQSSQIALWSLLPDGGANKAFASTGSLTLLRNLTIQNDLGNAIALVGNNLYVAGQSQSSTNKSEAILWNLTKAGTPVSTFASSGVWTGAIPSGANGTTATTVAVDGRGRIVVGGATLVPRRTEGWRVAASLWRLSVSGAADVAFNGTGTMTLPGATGIGDANDVVYDIVIGAGNRITAVGGGTLANGGYDMAAWRVR